jgi:heat shock protein HspQ
VPDETNGPVHHPDIEKFFAEFRDGHYQPKSIRPN